MVTVLIIHRVADYEAWQAAYDRIMEGPLGSEVRSYRIWQGQDDPGLVILAETYDSRKVAEAVFANPALPEAIAGAGVDMSSLQLHYLDEVASGTH